MEHVVLMILRKLTPTSFPQQTSVQSIFSGGCIQVVILNKKRYLSIPLDNKKRYLQVPLGFAAGGMPLRPRLCRPACLGYRRPDLQCQPVFASIVLGMALRRLHGVAPVSWCCTGRMALYGSHGVARVAWRCTGCMALYG